MFPLEVRGPGLPGGCSHSCEPAKSWWPKPLPGDRRQDTGEGDGTHAPGEMRTRERVPAGPCPVLPGSSDLVQSNGGTGVMDRVCRNKVEPLTTMVTGKVD